MTKSQATIITSLVLIGGGALTFWYIDHQAAMRAHKVHQELLREVRLAQAEGISLDRNSLKTPVPPAAENAAPIYDKIAAESQRSSIDEKTLGAVTLKLPLKPTAANLSQAKTVLGQHVRLLALIHNAAAKEKCVFRRNWDSPTPFDPMLPYASTMRKCARILEAESIVRAEDGHIQEGVQTQSLGFRIANHCGSQKTMIFDLVGIAINEISLGGMRKILSLHGEDPAVAKSVMDAIHNNTQAFNITDTLRTETTIQYAYIDYARTLAPKDVMPERKTFRIFGWKFPVLSYTQDEQNAYLDATERDILHRQRLDILASEHPFPQAILIFKANDANWTKQDDTHTELARGTEDIFSGYAGTVWNDRASSLVLETSARLLVWKSQHHAFPETLSAIGDTPPDPFSGKPFGYRREGAGFVLYSVGEDGAFDGGSSPAKLYENAPVFRYSAHS